MSTSNPACVLQKEETTGLFARTPGLVLGPFYPVVTRSDPDHVVWRADGACDSPAPSVEIFGTVTNRKGIPVAGALVEIWQADEKGRYRHPAAPLPGPEHPGFRGYGVSRTDVSGRYRFESLKPGPYVDRGQRRAPHVHFQITAVEDRLVTQMFFPDEPLNDSDRLYQSARRPDRLVAKIVGSSHKLRTFHWDVILNSTC